MSGLRLAVVGAGWAGLAAAVHARSLGHQVDLFEMAHSAGGRARSADGAHGRLDNGQHILIGAYTHTLALMRQVGVDPERLFLRGPLHLRYPDGSGLVLPKGRPVAAFALGVLRANGWSWADRWALLKAAIGWRLNGFQCDEATTVQDLCQQLPAQVMHDLIAPLCVAALNTEALRASGQVFLRVLRDALFSGPGGADLLLPKAPLADLLPEPALAWLRHQGVALHMGHRVMQIQAVGKEGGWLVDQHAVDAVVLATTAREATRLTADVNPAWSAAAQSLQHEPIVTVWLRDGGPRWVHPMQTLRESPSAPAQFAFDLQALDGPLGLFAWVISGAGPWVAQGLETTAQAVLAQARSVFPGRFLGDDALADVRAERRATFACTPGLTRPPQHIAPGLAAAGDYVQGPYPATLEGAVRSGRAAVDALLANLKT